MPEYNLGTAHGLIDIDVSSVDAAGRRLTSTGKQMLGFGTLLASGFVTAVKTAADFEKEISAIQAVTASTDADVDVLRQAALQLGSQGPFGPTEVAQAFLELAKAGLTATEIIEGAGTATINLAKAGDLDITRAAEIAANAMRTFGIEAKDVNGVVDTLSGAANQSTLDVDDLAVSLRYTGGVAAALQIPIEDVATALALLGNAGIKGSTGGTSLRRVLLQLSPDSKEARKELEKLGIISETGANQFFNAKGEAKDLNSVFQILRDSTKDLTDEQKINSINTIFGARASAAALILMEQAGQGFIDMDEAIAKTDAATVAAERLDNLSGAARRLKAAIQAYLIDAGSPFQKQLQGMVEKVTDFINKLSEGDSKMGKWIFLGTLFAGIFFIITGALTLTIGSILSFSRSLAVLGRAFIGVIVLMTRFASFLALNPVLLIIAAIIALGIALFILYKKNEGFRKFVDNLWQSMQKAWDKILPIIYAVGNAMVWVGKALKTAWDKSYPVMKRIVEVSWEIIQVVADIAVAVWKFLVRAAEITADVAQRIGKAVTDIIDFFRDLPGNVRRHLNTAFDAVVDFFQKLPGLALQGLEALGRLILAGLQKLPYLFGFVIGFIIGLWAKLWIKTNELMILGVIKLGQFLWWGLQKLVEILIQGLSWLIEKAVEFALDFPGKLLSFGEFIISKLAEILTKLASTVIGWIGEMISRALTFSVEFGEGVLKELPGLPAKLAGLLVDVLKKVKDWAIDMLGAAAQLGLDFMGKIWEEFKQLPQTILNAINSLFDIKNFLFQVGVDILQGLINGIFSLKDKVTGAVGDVISGIKKGFTSGFGLLSPSKVTTHYGKMISEGLIRGMDGERLKIIRLIDSMAGDLDRLKNIQEGMTSPMNIGSLLPVVRNDQVPVTVKSGNTINNTINNPVGQTAEESMFITAQKLEYLGVL